MLQMLAALMFALATAGTIKSPDTAHVHRVQVIMGTQAHVAVPKAQSATARKAFMAMQELDDLLSTYKKYSEVSRLNHAGRLENASKPLLRLIQRARKINLETRGYFDITVGSLIEGMGFHRLSEHEPEDLKKEHPAPAGLGSHLIQINGRNIRFGQTGLKIDFGGIGKGYAVDEAVQALRRSGVSAGRVALSGDIRCLSLCTIEISDPLKPSRAYARFQSRLPDTSISTSGNYHRYLGTKADNHLLNPKTKRSQNDFASVTLIGIGDNTRLDALTTAVSVMPAPLAKAYLETLTDIAYIVVTTKGERWTSPHLHRYVTRPVFFATAEKNTKPRAEKAAISNPKKETSLR